MEHFRSTLATTAIAVFGLVVAARSLHPGIAEPQAGPIRPVAAAPVAWTDPPARVAAPETTGTIRADARADARATSDDLPRAVPAPQRVAVMPPGAMPALPLPGEMAGPAEPLRKTAMARRPRASERAAHRNTRLRHAALARTATADRAAVAPAAPQSTPAAPAAKIDPIGDILRGLGIGRDS